MLLLEIFLFWSDPPARLAELDKSFTGAPKQPPVMDLSLIHCTKGYRFSRPQPGCHLPNSPWPGIIPSGDGKIIDLFLQCTFAFNGSILYCCHRFVPNSLSSEFVREARQVGRPGATGGRAAQHQEVGGDQAQKCHLMDQEKLHLFPHQLSRNRRRTCKLNIKTSTSSIYFMHQE